MVNREPRPLVGHDSWKAYAKRLSSQQAVPLHVRITDLIDQLIDTGALAEGDQLPPERVLAELFGASLAPVRQAILECVNRRLLVRSRGRGTFVRTSRLEEKVSILHSFTEAMGQQRAEVETRFVSQEIVAMPLAAAQVFGEDEDRALCITRLAIVEDEVVAALQTYLPLGAFPELASLSFAEGSVYDTLEKRYGLIVSEAESVFEVVLSRPGQAEQFGLLSGEPLLRLAGVSVADGTPVEYFHLLYRADKVRFYIQSVRPTDRVIRLVPTDRPVATARIAPSRPGAAGAASRGRSRRRP